MRCSSGRVPGVPLICVSFVLATVAACGGGASSAAGDAAARDATSASLPASSAGASGADDPSEPSPDPATPGAPGASAIPPASAPAPDPAGAPPPAPPGGGPAASGASAASGVSASGSGLTASGGWSGQVNGRFRCGDVGSAAVLTVQGNVSLLIRAEGGRIVSASFTGERAFAGSTTGGLPGSLTVSNGRAVVKGVTVPAADGGKPLVLDGTVTCT